MAYKLLKSSSLPTLYVRVTFAIFNLFGNIPFSNDKLNIYFNGMHSFPNYLRKIL